MCGIAGYIGKSKRPKVTYELITNLFDYLELRGTDASGVWATETGNDGRIVYHKEPIKSSEFIKEEFWRKLKRVKTDMLLIHARATSKGGGNAVVNANNHPFVTTDKRIGLVHNGTIDEAFYLKKKYQTLSQTDSECLLRIFEHGLDKPIEQIKDITNDVAQRVVGIRDIWSYIHSGAMAVALGERISEHERGLWLFRNEKRPLWLADLRQNLGQVFFFSAPEIWYGATANNTNLANLTEKLIEFPAHQAWYMKIDKENPVVISENIFKFKLDAQTSDKVFEHNEVKNVKEGIVDLKILTHLDDKDCLLKSKFKKQKINDSQVCCDDQDEPNIWHEEIYDQEIPYYDSVIKSTEHIDLCNRINNQVKAISTMTDNLMLEGSISQQEYDQLILFLESTVTDLQGTISLLR